MSSTTTPDLAAAGEDAIELARMLMRVDTSNPPGNETAAAVVLRDWLAARGVESELVGPDPDRLNLVATLPGRGDAPSIALCGHLDVVPAQDVEDWAHDPFGGELVDGVLHGRGAADMKCQVASRASTIAALAQSGVTPAGTVRLISQADEEVNTADVGMSWLVRNRPDLRTDWALEEGGGRHLTLADGRDVVFFGVADKALVGLELHVRGPGGHASRPNAVPNPVHALARLLSALEHSDVTRQLTPAADRMLRALGGTGADDIADDGSQTSIDALIELALRAAPDMGPSLDAITRSTFTPTGLTGSSSINVIPAHAMARIDCRALPGTSADDAAVELAGMLAAGGRDDDDWEVAPISRAVGGSSSEPDDRFTDACQHALGAAGTQALLIPVMNPFYTDADHLRSVWGTTTYGLWPWKHTPPDVYSVGIHASNERIHAADVAYATTWHLQLLLELAQA